jgi:hypothetical protein
MLLQKEVTSQRGCERYLAKHEAYAIIKQDQYSEMAQILDISKSGISFLCLNEGGWENESFAIDILDHGLPDTTTLNNELKNIPLLPIAYSKNQLKSPAPSQLMKRCGVSFGKLSSLQKARLNEYIMNYTCGSA